MGEGRKVDDARMLGEPCKLLPGLCMTVDGDESPVSKLFERMWTGVVNSKVILSSKR